MTPKKKSKNNPLTGEDKELNTLISSIRIAVEHVNSQLKIFRILSERYRSRINTFYSRFLIICSFYNLCLDTQFRKKSLVRKFLNAGVLDKGQFYVSEYGTPQGSIVSPILANIYMFYSLIKWFEKYVKPKLRGFASIINYADDFICCFQHKDEAEYFYKVLLPKRLKEVGLELAPDKTRLIAFGRFALNNTKVGKPETFDFLGFTHYCSKSKKGKFRVKRKTSRSKFNKKLVEFNMWCKDNRTMPIEDIMNTVKRKLIGHYNYFGITDNYHSICKFYYRSL